MFQDVLPQDEEEDEDDIEAHEASIQRLKVIARSPFTFAVNLTLCTLTGSRRCHTPDDSRGVSALF